MGNSFFNHCNIIDLSISSNDGKIINLIPSFTSFEIYEDIFSKYLHGTLSIKDTNNFLTEFPIKGGEFVSIKFSDDETNTNTANFLMCVEGVQPSLLINANDNKERYITFNLISVAGLRNDLIRVSYAFNTTTDKILAHLFSVIENLKTENFKVYDRNQMNYISNLWSINKNLDYISYKDLDGFFFETIHNTVYAKLSTLIKQNIKEIWQMAKTQEEFAYGKNYVKEYVFSSRFNITSLYDIRGLGKVNYNIPLENYNFNLDTYDLNTFYKEYPQLGKNKLFNDNICSGLYNVVGTSIIDEEIELKRNVIMQTLNNYNVCVKMNGSLERNAGDIISFNLPSIVGDSENLFDKNFQGKWIILQIKHMISNNRKYEQNLKIFKNSFGV